MLRFTILGKTVEKWVLVTFATLSKNGGEITTLTEIAIESKSVQKFIFDRFCKFEANAAFTTFAINAKFMANLVLRHEAKLSKIKQMWHLQMVCSKSAIEVNLFFRPVLNFTCKNLVSFFLFFLFLFLLLTVIQVINLQSQTKIQLW